MSQQTLSPPAPRLLRSSRNTPHHQETAEMHIPNTQNSEVQTSRSDLLRLSPEIRRMIISQVVPVGRPFMIGRSQEKHHSFQGSPRDIFTFRPTKLKVVRDERLHRPIQPAISRVCWALRQEALPLWYSLNTFWLIHNEFESGDTESSTADAHVRGFDEWISQVPAESFSFMRHVSLCGYSSWPNRMVVTLDLKNRELVGVRHYSTYGDEIPNYCDRQVEATRKALEGTGNGDLVTLKAVIEIWSFLFRIQRQYRTAPPGMMSGRQPASGWDYDW